MQFTKTLCLAALAAGALFAVAYAGSASATVLCATTTTPCNNRWGVNTEIDATLEAGQSSEIKDTSGNSLTKCNNSTLKLGIGNAGGVAATVEAVFGKANLTWAACAVPTATIAGGSVEIHHIAGKDDGTLTAKNMQVTVVTALFGHCVFSLGAAFVDIGTFTGGSIPAGTPPVIDINAPLTKLSGICMSTATWTATFEVTTPNGFGMYVEPS